MQDEVRRMGNKHQSFPSPYVCETCGAECKVEILDLGIGGYDCRGAGESDTQMDVVSDCCEGEVLTNDEEQKVVTYQDYSRG